MESSRKVNRRNPNYPARLFFAAGLADLPSRKLRPRVYWQNVVVSFGDDHGASLDVLSETATPFLLERANPSKDGDAKPWAFRRKAGGCQVAEGIGQAKSPSVPKRTF
jgi:hypothetical protein